MLSPLDVLSIETWMLLISVVVLIRFYIHKKWQFFKNRNIPHDQPSLLGLGSFIAFMGDPDAMVTYDLEHKQKYGPVFGVYFWLSPILVICDPEILKQIFIKEFSTFPNRQNKFLKVNGKEMNASLLSTTGDQWKRIRSTLTPTFSSAKLKAMMGIIEQCSDEASKSLKMVADTKGGRFDAKETFGRLSLDVICSAAFSANVHSQEGEETPKIVQMAKKAFDISFTNPVILLIIMFPWLETIFHKFDYSIFPRDMLNYFKSLTEVLIQKRRSGSSNLKQRVDLMQLMLNVKVSEEDVKNGATKGMTLNEIIGNSMIMMLAGYETTKSALVFLAYNLAAHKDVQEKLQQEIEETIKEHGGLTYDGINNMKYLTMCINESLRLYTPVARNARIAEKDITINGLNIPKGTEVQVPFYGMCHDDEYWDEPFEFKPERMEDMNKIDPMVYMPFGAGPRNCIGMRFALMEIKMAICKLLHEFDLDVCEDTPSAPLKVVFRDTIRAKDDISLKVIPRCNQ
ncbi:unnamed protein product [Clavelina lepadiformis]|uniref:Cytochrome P450 n=1 Tax=Clavelina lepadiformis TaxID=159417 RepID=A0ABP0FZ50_CLALP